MKNQYKADIVKQELLEISNEWFKNSGKNPDNFAVMVKQDPKHERSEAYIYNKAFAKPFFYSHSTTEDLRNGAEIVISSIGLYYRTFTIEKDNLTYLNCKGLELEPMKRAIQYLSSRNTV